MRLRLDQRFLLVAQRDEDRRIVVLADARVGARDRLLRRGAGAVRRKDFGDGSVILL